MRFNLIWFMLLAGALLLAGCGDSKTDEKTPTKSPVARAAKTTDDSEKTTNGSPSQLKPEIAKVVLSAEEEATCIVKQGDQFPEAKLPDLAGSVQTVSALRGEKATVVVLWTDQNRAGRRAIINSSRQAKEDLPGVAYVGINAGDDPADAKQAAEKAETQFPVLLDKDLSFFKQVVQVPSGREPADLVPRVYLLDAQGKILWMSVAFQEADERDLANALRFVLE